MATPSPSIETQGRTTQSDRGVTRSYSGTRTAEGATVTVWTCADNGNVISSYQLPWRLDLANHSPTGLEWGYPGSGPAQCALAILADLTGDDAYAKARYQEFKFQVVAKLPHPGWVRVFDKWVEERPLPEEDRDIYRPVTDVDREIAESYPSDCCGTPCAYRPERVQAKYRAFAVCTKCGRAAEI